MNEVMCFSWCLIPSNKTMAAKGQKPAPQSHIHPLHISTPSSKHPHALFPPSRLPPSKLTANTGATNPDAVNRSLLYKAPLILFLDAPITFNNRSKPNQNPSTVPSPILLFPAVVSSSLGMASRPRRLAAHKGFARRLWSTCTKEATFAQYTPFAVCLASGNLKIEQFRHYIYLHSCILDAFAQAYKRVEPWAEADYDAQQYERDYDPDDAKQALLSYKLNSFVEEWSVDLRREKTIHAPQSRHGFNFAVRRYTDFLSDILSLDIDGLKIDVSGIETKKIAAFVVSATTPRARLYALLGKQMKALPKDNPHPYQGWIDCYSSNAFEASVKQMEGLLESLSVSLTREELDISKKLYHQAMKHEVEVFCAQLTERTIVPLTTVPYYGEGDDDIVIFSDFDLTCSVGDTAKLLRRLTIRTAPKADPSQCEDGSTRMSKAELKNTWKDHERQCLEEYQQCIKSILPSNKVEFNYEILSKALEQVSDYKQRVNNRVIEYGLLKDLKLEDIIRAGELIRLREGCTSFFQEAGKNYLNASVHVLSYGCADLIKLAFTSRGLYFIDTHANELAYIDSITTGESFDMKTHLDKVEAFNEILKDKNNGSKNLTLCIGTGICCGDLLCLLQADIGIVIGSSLSLRRVGTRFGVSFRPLYPELVKIRKQYVEGNSPEWKSKSGVLYTVAGWAEIHALVFGWT